MPRLTIGDSRPSAWLICVGSIVALEVIDFCKQFWMSWEFGGSSPAAQRGDPWASNGGRGAAA